MKTASIIISGIILLLTITILSLIGRERYYSTKYNNTALGTTMVKLKRNWGKPDGYYLSGNCYLLRYDTSIMGSYLFEFKRNDTVVTAKYFDD
jgi:hypothetical protein